MTGGKQGVRTFMSLGMILLELAVSSFCRSMKTDEAVRRLCVGRKRSWFRTSLDLHICKQDSFVLSRCSYRPVQSSSFKSQNVYGCETTKYHADWLSKSWDAFHTESFLSLWTTFANWDVIQYGLEMLQSSQIPYIVRFVKWNFYTAFKKPAFQR